MISVNANGALQHWHTTSGKLLHTIYDELNQLLTVDYKPDGTLFATAGSDCCVRVYDEQTRKIKVEFAGGGNSGGESGHTNRVFAVKFDKEDENMLISGGWDNNVKVWDLREPNPVRYIYGPYICGDALDLHEGYILTGSWRADKQLQLWDFGTCEFIEDIPMNDGLASPQPCQIYAA
jgi:COMPASS component SWD3